MRPSCLLLLSASLAACGHAQASSCPAGPDVCLAERIPDAHHEVAFTPREDECVAQADECAEACRRGDANACFGRARVHQARGDAEAAETFFELACEHGSMLGCTNRAAGMLLESDPPDECVARVLERTCDAAEPWGCGMLGLMLIQGSGVPKDLARGREVLEGVCASTNHPFGCAVLARALAQGLLGEADAAEAERYRRLACERGDVEACAGDEPPSAAAAVP